MKYSSYKWLLASSCLVLSLAVSSPLFGVGNDEESARVSTPVVAPTPVQEPVQEDNWKDSLYEFPELQAGFKINVFNRLLMTPEFKDPKKEAALFECLEEAAFDRRNPKALEKVKQFSTHPVLHINRVNSAKAKKVDQLLREGLVDEKNAQCNGLSISQFLYRRGATRLEGRGVKKDPVLARQFFFRSLELDPNSDTLYCLGILYSEGSRPIPQNLTMAQLLWEKAAAGGNEIAMESLADIYWQTQNFSKAIEYSKKLSEKGDFTATLNLATFYFNGDSGEEDRAQALKYLLRAYNSPGIGSSDKISCADRLGCLYFNGLPETLPDYRKALQFYRQADVSNPGNQYSIGMCYLDLKEYKNAYKWLNKAAAQHEPNAFFYLANLSYMGLGTKKNMIEARRNYKLAAKFDESENHVAKSLFNYGVLIEDIDRNTSRNYMLQAAERGFSRAMISLAVHYLRIQTPYALAKAFFWIEKAQELNDPAAQALFEAATKRTQEDSKDDENLVKCMESLSQADVIESLADDSPSSPPEGVDSPASISASVLPQESLSSSDSSEDEEVKPAAADDYTITPEEIKEWQAEQAKWKEDIKNPKFVREKLQQAHQDFQDKQKGQERPPLSIPSTKIIETLRDKGSRSHITIDNLFALFDDPYFQGQVDMSNTTDGYSIVGYNFTTGKTKSTGTHRKHNKSYKGLDANFLKSVADLVEEYMPSLGVQGQ
jgi:TPR repeat protein